MRLKEQLGSPKERRLQASTVLRHEEVEKPFSIKTFFTEDEWQEVRSGVFRDQKDFGYVHDRFLLSAVSDSARDQLQPDEQDKLFKIGDGWVQQVLERHGKTEVTVHNWHQALHCAGVIALAFPNKKQSLSEAPLIKEFIHNAPGMIFMVDRLHKRGVGLRILLKSVRDYLCLFPGDREWAFEKLTEKKIYPEAVSALEELAGNNDWAEYTHLAAELRLVFPDFKPSNLSKIIAEATRAKRASGGLYTLLPEVLNLRILAADHAALTPDGRLLIQDQPARTSISNPLPPRLVA